MHGCIATHAHAAVRHGASLQEAAEAIGVTILMNDGPATIYGPRAFAAFSEFHAGLAAAGMAAATSDPADGAGHSEHGHGHHQHPEGS